MTISRPPKPTFKLLLEALPQADDPTGVRRLRAFLKSALRAWKLRCLRVEPHQAEPPLGKPQNPDICACGAPAVAGRCLTSNRTVAE